LEEEPTEKLKGATPLRKNIIITLSPNYEEDEATLIGNTNGEVYWSNDDVIRAVSICSLRLLRFLLSHLLESGLLLQ